MGTQMLLPGQSMVLKIKELSRSGTEFQDERNGMTHIIWPVPLFLSLEQLTKYTYLQRLMLVIQIKESKIKSVMYTLIC
jgi:hypothetical protein